MVETTRVFECMACHAEIMEEPDSPLTTEGRTGEFAATSVLCPACGAVSQYDTGSDQSGDSQDSVVVPCAGCDTVVEAYGVSPGFVEHVRARPDLHDLHRGVLATPGHSGRERPG